MNIVFKDDKAKAVYDKCNDNIRKSLRNAMNNYDELKSVPECNRTYDHPMNDIPVNTETCMEAFGDMLKVPAPERIKKCEVKNK